MQESALHGIMDMSSLRLKIGLESEALRRTVQNVYSMAQTDGHLVQIVRSYYLEDKDYGLC